MCPFLSLSLLVYGDGDSFNICESLKSSPLYFWIIRQSYECKRGKKIKLFVSIEIPLLPRIPQHATKLLGSTFFTAKIFLIKICDLKFFNFFVVKTKDEQETKKIGVFFEMNKSQRMRTSIFKYLIYNQRLNHHFQPTQI